jgi:heme/copper-type cytochrome/quinol oxidase subunit 1
VFGLVRRFIKTAIGFLIIGLLLGSYLMVRRELFGEFPSPYLRSAHVHVVGIGFVMFLILGVALWLFPRAPKDDRRYSPQRIATVYWLLLISTAVRFLAEGSRAWSESRALAWIVVVSGFGQLVGLLLYFWTMWSRIRPVGSHLREAAGEKF